jgi:tRNA (adenine57-N1/adenine58-N1)-methyltransferase
MDRIILVDEKGRKRLVPLSEGAQKVSGLGVIDFSKIPGDPEGKKIDIAGKEYIILKPSVLDLIDTIEREAQIITPKDSSSIILNCDIKSGDRILEIGAGSGALTIVLAHFVSPGGTVVSYEKREDFARLVGKNIKKAGMDGIVDVKVQDALDGIGEKDFDSVVADIPNPWDVLGQVNESLKPSGHLAIYVPTVNQMEKAVREMRRLPFIDIRSIEILQREMEVGERGSRPSFDMLGHTGYLTFARKLVE